MGLFQQKQPAKKSADDQISDNEQHFFDEYFREELRNHGRWYFEKVIAENGKLFKKELDATIQRVDGELKEYLTKQVNTMVEQIGDDLKGHVTSKIEEQVTEHSKAMQEAQDAALTEINQSVSSLREQHKELTENLTKSVAEQQERTKSAIDEYNARMTAMKEAQDTALASINESTQALKQQQQALTERLEKNVTEQEDTLVTAFEDNMAKIIEHYLLEALGDQYDVKAQLPAIIKQMEDNKQAIVDDMKL
jgi:uncharacterized protein YoxC